MTRKVTGPHKIGHSDKLSAYFRKKQEKEAEIVRGMIGNVPKLAPGHENIMWNIQKNLPRIAKRVAPLLDKPKKKTKKTTYNLNQGIVIGDKLDEADADLMA